MAPAVTVPCHTLHTPMMRLGTIHPSLPWGGVLFGDIDDNRSVTLADAILTLQIISGQEPASPPVKKSDVNGDQRIGMENAIYILQKLSE